ncbi:Glutathione S-transferase domain protein [Acidovorax delafieldii 2AN]|uniref:Glutathione S-transferase domain protein n=1 Tax=Acidovorax delafieldii 2AN TaxID=573060 RepID=C5T4R8_ACIDE|nr:glutathione S-transferase [Acidovorax delafieldii]EER60517.1 Glutathione S-transferase domain protein [Acidovorax delafieldii 2AN]
MSTLPVLYSFRRCPYAMRARLALAVSGQLCELREVVLKNKPQGLLQVSPKATVPVLVLPSGQVLEQSLDIMRWALARHDPAGWLTPSNSTEAAMLALVAQCDGPFKQALDCCKYPSRYPEADTALARTQAVEWLRGLEALLARHPFLCGDHAALTDMAIAPFVRQFAGIDGSWWNAQPWPHLQAWLAQWQASSLFEGVMHKLPAWVDGTEGVLFPHSTGTSTWQRRPPA